MNGEHRNILIKNGNIQDGNGNIFFDTDILVVDGKINKIAKGIELNEDIPVYDATDKVVLPGFIESLNIWGCTGPGWRDNA